MRAMFATAAMIMAQACSESEERSYWAKPGTTHGDRADALEECRSYARGKAYFGEALGECMRAKGWVLRRVKR